MNPVVPFPWWGAEAIQALTMVGLIFFSIFALVALIVSCSDGRLLAST